MAAIKDLTKSAQKLVANAGNAAQAYSDGVQNPRRPWAEAAAAAEDSYKQGVTAAAAAGRFGKGVRKAGDAKQKTRAATLGAQRYPAGVASAAQAYQEGFAPYHAGIGSVTLPPRGPKGSPSNIQRVTAIATRLRQIKEAAGK